MLGSFACVMAGLPGNEVTTVLEYDYDDKEIVRLAGLLHFIDDVKPFAAICTALALSDRTASQRAVATSAL